MGFPRLFPSITLPFAVIFLTSCASSEKGTPGGPTAATLSGRDLLHFLGQDYADPYVANPDILRACARLRELTNSNTPVAEVDYLTFVPRGNLGFGEHAALALQFGSNEQREFIVIDIGRRPPESNTPELSVLRVYDLPAFLHYSLLIPRET